MSGIDSLVKHNHGQLVHRCDSVVCSSHSVSLFFKNKFYNLPSHVLGVLLPLANTLCN